MLRPASLLQAEFALVHNHIAINVNGWIFQNAVNVGFAFPFCAGFCRMRTSESNMNTRKFFILQKVINQLFQAGICAYRKLADPVAVFIVFVKLF